MSLSPDEVVAAYAAAWLATDSAERATLLQKAWTGDGTYSDPNNTASGRQALDGLIGGFQAHSNGARIEVTSKPAAHNGHVYFTWRMVDAAGAVVIEGVDFGTLAPDGRLSQIVGFFGTPPPLDG